MAIHITCFGLIAIPSDGLLAGPVLVPAVATVTHHDRTTAYATTDRAGPTVLAVHGSGATRTVWKAQRARLESTVVAVDLAGHGASDAVTADPGPALLEAYVDDVAATARATGADVLMGHSLGGAVILQTVLDRSVDLDGAIVIGCGARLPVSDQLLTWLEEDFDRVIEFLNGPDRLFHDPSEPLRTRSRTLLEEVGRAVTRRDFQTCATYDVRDRLAELDLPILALVGAHDQLTPTPLLEELVTGLPTAELIGVPAAAHLAMVERPTPVNDAITAFLTE